MSHHVTAGGHQLTLHRREGQRGYWVRLESTGRTLGIIGTTKSRWMWQTWPSAFRGDGRPGHLTDGHPSEVVPHVLEGHGEKIGTRQEACDQLVTYLNEQSAPVLGYGPHPVVLRHVMA